MGRPSSTSSAAAGLPISRASRLVPPRPVGSAIWISGWPNTACSSAMRKSQVQPSSAPPPEQSPEIAAITTASGRRISSMTRGNAPPGPLAGLPSMVSARSCSHACSHQWPGTAEASTMARARPCSRASIIASAISCTAFQEPLFWMRGLDIVTTATPSRGYFKSTNSRIKVSGSWDGRDMGAAHPNRQRQAKEGKGRRLAAMARAWQPQGSRVTSRGLSARANRRSRPR